MADDQLHLVLPHYASLFANRINHSVCPSALQKLIGKGRFQPSVDSLERTLIRMFQPPSDSVDLPMSLLKIGQENHVLVSPCHVYADRGHLLLFHRDIHLSADESAELYAHLQPLFSDYGLLLHINESGDCYLTVNEADLLPIFTALTELEGQPVLDALPSGMNAERWIKMWNEAQMILFDCALNQQREAKRQLPVNSVWFWGCAEWYKPTQSWKQIYGQHALLKLLADKTDTPLQPALAEHDRFELKGSLICLPELDWQADISEQLAQLDNSVFRPVWQALRHWRLKKVTLLVPEYGVYTLTPLDSWKMG